MPRWPRIPLILLLFSPCASGTAFGQLFIDRGAITPVGDIYRGQGVFLEGAGLYNYYSAMGYSIEVDANIRLNEYIYQSFESMRIAAARRREQRFQERRAAYEKEMTRLRNDPDHLDLTRGDALNSMLKDLLDPKIISPSSFRDPALKVSIPVQSVRAIPFLFAPANATFSMKRLTAFETWPTMLRDKPYVLHRKSVERAYARAMDELVAGKISTRAIADLDASINQLEVVADDGNAKSRDRLYNDAKAHIRTLRDAVELLKDRRLQQIVAELDRYAGTTVGDLVEFMRRNNLRFGSADIGDESELYPKVFAGMKQMLNATTLDRADNNR